MATALNRKQRRQQERAQRKSGHTANASRPKAQVPSRLRAPPGVDHHAHLRGALRTIAKERGDWAGIPMPLDGESLVVEPTYPNAKALMEMCGEKHEPHDLDGAKQRNSWYSLARRSDIIIFDMPDGRIDWGLNPGMHSLPMALKTLGCSDAWGLEQEATAIELLASLVTRHQFKQYMTTGMFIESSKRSGVFYLFRRLRPTVAIRAEGTETRIMCALCMHPIAYYSGSWAGAMCPTDDVVAHLMFMRADERRFWAKCNQHPAWRPQSGL